MRGCKRWLVGAATLMILAAVLAGCGASEKKAASTVAQDQVTRAEFAKFDITGNATSSEIAYQVGEAARPMSDKAAAGAAGKAVVVVDRKVIKNAELNLQVRDLLAMMQRIEARVDAIGGLVADSSLFRGANGDDSAKMTLRIPSSGFGNFLPELESMGKVLRKRIYSQDVTKEYLDLEARISNFQHQEERLLQILAQAKTVEDILKVEAELARVRGLIETNTGELNFLKDRVSYSTITLSLQAQPIALANLETSRLNGVWGRSAAAFVSSINNLMEFSGNLMVFLFGFFPVAAALMVAGVLAWPLRRRYIAHRRGGTSSSGPTN